MGWLYVINVDLLGYGNDTSSLRTLSNLERATPSCTTAAWITMLYFYENPNFLITRREGMAHAL